MRKIFPLIFVFLFSLNAAAQGASMPFPDKSGDKVLQAMISETVPKFQQLTYKEKRSFCPKTTRGKEIIPC